MLGVQGEESRAARGFPAGIYSLRSEKPRVIANLAYLTIGDYSYSHLQTSPKGSISASPLPISIIPSDSLARFTPSVLIGQEAGISSSVFSSAQRVSGTRAYQTGA